MFQIYGLERRREEIVALNLDSGIHNFKFPGGEIHATVYDESLLDKYDTLVLTIHGPTSDDLIAAISVAEIARKFLKRVILFIPYIPAARADRGIPFGAGIYANLINQIQADTVFAIDPHSRVSVGLINNLVIIPIAPKIFSLVGYRGYNGVIAPDAGAHTRAKDVADLLGVPVIQAGKVRDFETGKLSGFSSEPVDPESRYLIVDDICDGGGTFIGLAEHLSSEFGIDKKSIDLWTTHGIFSKGTEILSDVFGSVFTTDSWINPVTNEITVFSTLHMLDERLSSGY